MDARILKRVLGWSLPTLLLVLPGALGATWTPGTGGGRTAAGTAGLADSSAALGARITDTSEALAAETSTSQLYTASGRNLRQTRTAATHSAATHAADHTHTGPSTALTDGQTHSEAHTAGTHTAGTHTFGTHAAGTDTLGTHISTAGRLDTEQTQTLTGTSSHSLERSTQLSTEPITSILTTTEASSSSSSSSSSDWEDLPTPDRVLDISSAVSLAHRSWTGTDETSSPQDSPDTPSSVSQTDTALSVRTDSLYASTTISRAGERTLLSVTSSSSNSTLSAFTDESNSRRPPSTWAVPAKTPQTEGYTDGVLLTLETTPADQHVTHSTEQSFPETPSPEASTGTRHLTEQPVVTQDEVSPVTSEGIANSTPPLTVTDSSRNHTDVSLLSPPPIISLEDQPSAVTETVRGDSSSVPEVSTESSTVVHTFITHNQGGTEGLSSQTTEDSTSQDSTTAPPSVSAGTTELDDSQTTTPMPATDVYITTASSVTERRFQTAEEEIFESTAPPTTTPTPSPSPVPTSPNQPSTASNAPTPGSPTQTTEQYTTMPTTVSTLGRRTSAAPTQHLSTSQNHTPPTKVTSSTNVATPQLETSTAAVGITTTGATHTTTTHSYSTPARTSEAPHTTGEHRDKGTTPLATTTAATDLKPTNAPPSNPCVSNPCMNGGMCVSYEGHKFTCHCQHAWTGPTCSQDVDECDLDPCPSGSRCVNTRGSFICECPLGFDLEDGRTCTKAKTFLGTFSVNRLPPDPLVFKSATMHEIQREIIQLLNASLSMLRGYSRSTLSKKEHSVSISAVNMFSITTDVTSTEVYNSIQMSLSNCSSSVAHCRMVLHLQLTYHAESLCSAQQTQCDQERSSCTDNSGTASCQCLQGYYKHNPDDLSCLDCGDGYKLENGTCVQCMFGFGGFNCGNFYKLIAVVVSPAGGGLLLILIIALIVTCCKKDKNDISKIIFKSGDLQMSPYADFPKCNRVSMEWGRETIEMQENGSTKNLLQMTDIYYSPALRNADLERNGLYPFTGLPGSRHSCIYPAQWNPSFISDDSRRRDYF